MDRVDLCWMAAGMWLVGSAAVLAITPFLVEDQPASLNHLRWANAPARFGLCFLTMSVLCGFALLHSLAGVFNQRAKRVLWGLLLVLTVIQIGLQTHPYTFEFRLIDGGLAGISIGILLLTAVWLDSILRDRRARMAAGFAICGLLAVGTGFLSQHWHGGYAVHFNRYFRTSVFTSLEAPVYDYRKICVLDERSYPFFGSRRQHHVSTPFRLISREWLEGYLREVDCEFVTALRGQDYSVHRYRGAAELLKQEKSKYRPLFDSGPVSVMVIKSQHRSR